mgnify:CR=1 FL=1
MSSSRAIRAAMKSKARFIVALGGRSSRGIHRGLYVGNQLGGDRAQLVHGGFVHIQIALVLCQIALLVRGIQDPPTIGRPAYSVGKALKHGVAVFTAVALPAQGGQGGRMGSVVGR